MRFPTLAKLLAQGPLLRPLLQGLVLASALSFPARAAEDPALALGFYVGKWVQSGVSRPDPGAAFTPLNGHENCDWVDGSNAVVCHESITDYAGTTDSLYIMGYDHAQGRYFVKGTDYAAGGIISGTGTLNDGVWTWDSVMQVGDARIPMRFVFKSAPAGGRELAVTLKGEGGQMFEAQRVSYRKRP
ncbi:MAG: hypothetical protein DI568_02960 [Sphingomonas sp.]|nr:MAG: hypothetical protein DI568_02960 [Sphingomonas sp.]